MFYCSAGPTSLGGWLSAIINMGFLECSHLIVGTKQIFNKIKNNKNL